MLRKYAKVEVLGVKSSAARLDGASLSAFASFDDYKTDDGFLYVRVRAISSRVNKNHDGWPSDELSKSYRTFIGKPLFVDHHNSDPKKARGVVVDAELHVEEDIEKTSSLDPYYASAPPEHMPPTWIELLLEVDAKRFPKLAKAIVNGDIDGVSMGANVERSKCSHCGNWATTPEEYCNHVRSKGAYFDFKEADGTKTSKKAYEDCYDIGFFELSFVFDPADETALLIDKKMAKRASMIAVYSEEYGPRETMRRVASAMKAAGFEDWSLQEAQETVIPDSFYVITDSGNFANMGGETEPLGSTYGGFDSYEEAAQAVQAAFGDPEEQGVQIMSGQEIIDAVARINEEYGQGGVMDLPPVSPGQPMVPEWEGEPGEFGAPSDLSTGFERQPADDTAWRAEQYVNAGMDPETANQLAQRRDIDWHAVVDALGKGATPEQAIQIFTRVSSQVTDDEFMWAKTAEQAICKHEGCNRIAAQAGHGYCTDHQEDYWKKATVRTADNPPPQSEMTTAPEEVDTLRQDRVCPICGSDMEEGICEVCNYEEPPEGFNNPDLEAAKEIDLRKEEEQGEAALEQQQAPPTQPGQSPEMGMTGAPGMQQPIQSSTNTTTTAFFGAAAQVKVENRVSRTAGINTQERPILPVTRKLTDKPKNQNTVKDPKEPVESNRKESENDMTDATIEKTADGASPQGEGVAADKRVDVEGVGAVTSDPLSGIDSENVEKDTGDFTAPHTDTWSGEEGDSLPTADAVTSDTGDFATVSATKTAEVETLEQNAVGAGFPDHDPAHVDLEALLSEEVGDRTMTDSSATAFRSLEQAPAVTKGESGNDLGGPIGEALASAKSRIFKAMKVAEAEVGLGLLPAESKFDRVAELEESTEEALDAQLETLAKVRTAGLRKPQARRAQAGRMPSLRNVVAATAGFDIEAHAVPDQQIEDAIGW